MCACVCSDLLLISFYKIFAPNRVQKFLICP